MTSKRGVYNSFLTFIILFISLAGFAKTEAQDITLSFPDEVTGEPEEQFSIDVTASDLTDLNIFNFELEMSFDSSLLDISTDGIQEGDILAGPLTVNVTDDDRILVSYASSQALSGSGTLFTVSGTLSPDEGNNPEGLKVIYMLLSDGSLDVAPSVPVDIAVEVGTNNGITLDFGGEITGLVGETFSSDITVSDLTDLGVSNFDMELSFESSLLTITDGDIQGGDLLGGPLTVNVTNDDRILVSYASSQDLEGTGTLFTVSGTLAGEGSNAEGLKVTSVLIGDGSLDVIPAVPVNIGVEVEEPIEWELSSQIIELSSPEAANEKFDITQTAGTQELTWQLSSGANWLSLPNGMTGIGSASVSVAIDENTQSSAREGEITITTNAGSKTVIVTQPGQSGEVSLDFGGPITGQVGETFSRDITVSDLTGLGVSNFDMEIDFDSSLLSIESADVTGGDLLAGPLTVNVTSDNRILVSYASSQNLEGAGTLFTVSGTLAGTGENQEALKLTNLLIGDGSLNVTPSVPVNIAFEVVDSPRDVELSFGEAITGLVGESFSRDITVSDLSGLGVSNFDMEIEFDGSLLSILDEDIQGGDLLAGPLTVNVTSDNRILVSYASSQNLEGAGTLFTFSGTLAGVGENQEGLKVTDMLIGDGSLTVTPSVPINIAVDVDKVPIEWTLSPQTVGLDDASASTFELTIDQTKGAEELSWSVSTKAAWLTLQGSESGTGDAALVYDAAENESNSARQATIEVSTNAEITTQTVTVTQPGAEPIGEVELDFGGPITGQVGEPFSREITVSDLSDLGVSNFDMEMEFDSSLLSISDDDIDGGDLLSGPLTVNVTNDDRILVSYASSQPLSGAGTLFTISGLLASEGENQEGLKVIDLLIGDGSLTVTPEVPIDIKVEVDEPITWELSEESIDLSGPEAVSDEFEIIQTAGTEVLTWDLSSNVDWLSFPNGTSGSGSASVAITIELNLDSEPREGIITIDTNAGSDQIFVRQSGFMMPKVVLQSPANGAENIALNTSLTWSPVEQATRYRIDISTDQSHDDTIVREPGVSHASYSPDNLDNSTTYYWRVQAFNEQTGYGDWSETWSFTTVDQSFANIQIIHNSPDPAASSVDIFINGESFLTDVDFRTATSFVEVPSGVDLDIEIAPAGAGIGEALDPIAINLTENQDYIAVVSGVLDPSKFEANPGGEDIAFALKVISGRAQRAPDEDTFSFRIHHGTTDAPAMDIFARGTAPLAMNIAYGATADFVNVSADLYTIDVAPAGGNVIASYEVDANDLGGQTGLVLASGFLTSENDQNVNDFGVLLVLADGTTELLPILPTSIDKLDVVPSEFELEQNYPNPFNPTTMIKFSIPESASIKLEIFNMLGQQVDVLIDEFKSAGSYQYKFDASNLSSGTYLYRLQAGDFVKTEKMMLIK